MRVMDRAPDPHTCEITTFAAVGSTFKAHENANLLL